MKTVMSGQPISLSGRINYYIALCRRHRSSAAVSAESDISFHNMLLDILRANVSSPRPAILDVGCGQLARQTVLFVSDGANVTGIDVELPVYSMNLRRLFQALKTNGLERVAKSFMRHLFFDRAYMRELGRLYCKPICRDHLNLRVMSVTNLQFPEDTFDFVYSVAVMEHIDNVTLAVQEINRVLTESGVAWIGIDLFPSIGGGHHPFWAFPDSQHESGVPPWDHLRGNKYPVNLYLNRLRLDDYKEIFSRHMIIVSESLKTEGENRLDPVLFNELSQLGYKREDLVTRFAGFLCRKK